MNGRTSIGRSLASEKNNAAPVADTIVCPLPYEVLSAGQGGSMFAKSIRGDGRT
jgi:hypothetical protein